MAYKGSPYSPLRKSFIHGLLRVKGNQRSALHPLHLLHPCGIPMKPDGIAVNVPVLIVEYSSTHSIVLQYSQYGTAILTV
jgi:hypothetical protein